MVLCNRGTHVMVELVSNFHARTENCTVYVPVWNLSQRSCCLHRYLVSVFRMTQKLSKHLSFVLRHHPESVGVTLDPHGWTDVDALCTALDTTYEAVAKTVESNDKQRFEFDVTGTLIRARQGHSVTVDLQLKPSVPPDVLLHGTKEQFLLSIFEQGIRKMSRQYVQLSETQETATQVANRREGRSVILRIDAKRMHQDGFTFIVSSNHVWMIDCVPPEYIFPLTP